MEDGDPRLKIRFLELDDLHQGSQQSDLQWLIAMDRDN